MNAPNSGPNVRKVSSAVSHGMLPTSSNSSRIVFPDASRLLFPKALFILPALHLRRAEQGPRAVAPSQRNRRTHLDRGDDFGVLGLSISGGSRNRPPRLEARLQAAAGSGRGCA